MRPHAEVAGPVGEDRLGRQALAQRRHHRGHLQRPGQLARLVQVALVLAVRGLEQPGAGLGARWLHLAGGGREGLEAGHNYTVTVVPVGSNGKTGKSGKINVLTTKGK